MITTLNPARKASRRARPALRDPRVNPTPFYAPGGEPAHWEPRPSGPDEDLAIAATLPEGLWASYEFIREE